MMGNDYMIKFFNLISVIALSISNVACAKNNEVLCNTNNVEKNLQCIQKENISRMSFFTKSRRKQNQKMLTTLFPIIRL